VLTNNLTERTYFDSSDYALATADRVTDDGAIQTGKAHPHLDSISHPNAPIPAASNVDKDAIEDLHRKSVSSPEKRVLSSSKPILNIQNPQSRSDRIVRHSRRLNSKAQHSLGIICRLVVEFSLITEKSSRNCGAYVLCGKKASLGIF
jgi:hypothetical protein